MDMETLTQRLEAQRARLRNIYLLHGLTHIALRLLALSAILFFLDFAVVPPEGARLTMAFLSAGYLIYACHRYLVYPMSRRITRQDMALLLERRFSALDGGLVSALQFHSSGKGEYRGMSRGLMRAAIEFGAGKADPFEWKDIFDITGLKKMMLVTGLVFVPMAGYGFMNPGLVRIWAARMMGADMDWPRSTTLHIIPEGAGENFKFLSEPDPGGVQELMMARGTSLPITVTAEGRDPGEVMVVQERGGTGPIESRAIRRNAGKYKYRFRNVRSDMRFWVHGGDDSGRGRHVDVTVVVPPEVLSIESEYKYPEYLGIDSETRSSSRVEAPSGTRVDMRFLLSKPAGEAVIALRFGGGAEQTYPLDPDPEDPLRFLYTLDVERSGTYQVRLIGEEGFANVGTPTHSIIAKSDSKPRVRLYYPGSSDFDSGPRGVVVMRAAAEDDYGIKEMKLCYKPAGNDEFTSRPFGSDEIDQPYGARRIVADHVMDLVSYSFVFDERSRKVEPGDALIYSVEAYDSRPDMGEGKADTGRHLINIVSENELIRLLTERQIRMKEEIQSLRNLQAERMRDGEEELEAALEQGWNEQKLTTMQIRQNQLTNRFKRATKELAHIFDEYLFNRIDRSPAASVMLEKAVSVRLEERLTDSFDPGTYAALISFFESGKAGEMDLMERLTSMLGMGMSISESLSPDAAGFLAGGLARAGTSEPSGMIRKSLDKQQEIIDVLDVLLQRMDEWEDFQELLQLFRDVIDYQFNLNILTREELRKRD